MDTFDETVEKTIKFIVNQKPNFIETKNSYDRKVVYSALEKINMQNIVVRCNRNKKWIKAVAKVAMCQKHKCSLAGGCDCCSDPWCCGPYCNMCSEIKYCRHAVDVGDEMYASKIVIGINLFYDDKNQKKYKFKKLKFNQTIL